MKIIDLRSDTVTKPSARMREAMYKAEVGDDVYGEDPTINRLQNIAAEMLDMEAALYVSSGTQGNLLALLSQCQRGDEYLVGQEAHAYRFEGGGAAVLGSIQPQPVELNEDATLPLNKAEKYIKPDNIHFAKTRLLALENTHKGIALPGDYIEEAKKFAKERNLKLHLDGARIFNASVKTGIPVDRIADGFDSVSLCLSKGLGAPVGSLLLGSRELIAEALRWRKMLGGGMRQAGIIAAAGIYALKNNVSRLEEDHHNAESLARGLAEIEEIKVEYHPMQTNMVFVHMSARENRELMEFLKPKGIVIRLGKPVRLVTHLDIAGKDVEKVISAFKEFFSGGKNEGRNS